MGCNAELAAAEGGWQQRRPLVARRTEKLRLVDVNPFLCLQRSRAALSRRGVPRVGIAGTSGSLGSWEGEPASQQLSEERGLEVPI